MTESEQPEGEEVVEYETPNDALSRIIEQGVNEWLQELGGGFVTAFTAHVEYVNPGGQHCWAVGGAPSQTPSQTLGLLRWHQMLEESKIEMYFASFEDDEEYEEDTDE